MPFSPIVVEPNIGVQEATKEPQEENLVTVVTSNPEATKHGQKVQKSNNPPTNTMVSWEALMESMDQACHSSNPPTNLNSDIMHSKLKVNVCKEKPNLKWNMSFGAQSKRAQEMETTTNQSKTNKTIKKKPNGDQLLEEYAHKKNKTMGTKMVLANNATLS